MKHSSLQHERIGHSEINCEDTILSSTDKVGIFFSFLFFSYIIRDIRTFILIPIYSKKS